MIKVNLDEIFFDLLNAAKPFVPESDHSEMITDILRSLDDQGYDINDLYGHDDEVDNAIDLMHPNLDEEYEEDY